MVALEWLRHTITKEAGAGDGTRPEAALAGIGSGRGQAAPLVCSREQLQLLRFGQVRGGDTQQSHPDAADLGSGQLEGDAPDLFGLVGRSRQGQASVTA